MPPTGELSWIGRPQPLPVLVLAVLPVEMPIMNFPQSVLDTLPFRVRAKAMSVPLLLTSMLRMSSVPLPVVIPGSISPAESKMVAACE